MTDAFTLLMREYVGMVDYDADVSVEPYRVETTKYALLPATIRDRHFGLRS